MNIKSLEISGFRGFSSTQKVNFAIPDGQKGSGLTIIVGPNNAGKSTIVESLKAISSKHHQAPSFSTGKRNVKAGDFVKVNLITENGSHLTLSSISKGSSESKYDDSYGIKSNINLFVLHSRRNFEPFFYKHETDRDQFLQQADGLLPKRSGLYQNFNSRLFNIAKNPNNFNKTIKKILGDDFEWTLDTSDQGDHFIKIIKGDISHSSDGAGEGIVSLFTIVDALHDSQANQIIAIDEPELSLHPSLQKKLIDVLSEYAKDRQIIISTHSPYFINWNNLFNGGKLARVVNSNEYGTEIYNLKNKTKNDLKKLTGNFFNPHTLGLAAVEVFFLNDNIILTEGQEDVLYFRIISDILNIDHKSDFFGYGAGGAGNIEAILNLLLDLGFKKVSIILDNDKQKEKDELANKFSNYNFHCIPTHDVRDKEAVKPREEIIGLIDRKGENIKEEYKEELESIFNTIKKYNE